MIDLYQLHCVDPAVPIEESVGELERLRQEGKVRLVGVSNVSLDQLQAAIGETMITTVQNPLSPMRYDESSEHLLRFCEANGITWMAYAPLGGHRNTKRLREYEEWARSIVPDEDVSMQSMLLAWCVRISDRVIPIPATSDYSHLRDNMRAATLQLSGEQIDALSRPKSWAERYEEAGRRGDHAAAVEQLLIGLRFQPEGAAIWYDLACAACLKQDHTTSIHALERAVELGFDDLDHLETDEDLSGLHGTADYTRILRSLGGLPDSTGGPVST